MLQDCCAVAIYGVHKSTAVCLHGVCRYDSFRRLGSSDAKVSCSACTTDMSESIHASRGMCSFCMPAPVDPCHDGRSFHALGCVQRGTHSSDAHAMHPVQTACAQVLGHRHTAAWTCTMHFDTRHLFMLPTLSSCFVSLQSLSSPCAWPTDCVTSYMLPRILHHTVFCILLAGWHGMSASHPATAAHPVTCGCSCMPGADARRLCGSGSSAHQLCMWQGRE